MKCKLDACIYLVKDFSLVHNTIALKMGENEMQIDIEGKQFTVCEVTKSHVHSTIESSTIARENKLIEELKKMENNN